MPKKVFQRRLNIFEAKQNVSPPLNKISDVLPEVLTEKKKDLSKWQKVLYFVKTIFSELKFSAKQQKP